MQPFTLNQLTRRVLASPGGGSQKNRTQWVLALLYIFQVLGTPKPEYTFVGRCRGLREPISKQSKAPYVYKLLGTLKQMKDPCAKGRMWSWIAGHSDATILGSLPPLHTPHGQSRGMTDGPSVCVQPALNGVEEALLKIVLWIQPTQKGRPKVVAPKKDCGVDTPALSLLGPHKSPIPEKRMREKQPGSVPRREIPTRRGIMVPWTQPTQKGRPKKAATPALSLLGPQKSPMREYPGGCPGGRVPKKGTQPTQKGRPKKDRIPVPKRGARVPLTQPTQKGRPQKDRIPFPKRGMWEYPGARMTPGAGWPRKDRIPFSKRGMWEFPGERMTPGAGWPHKDRIPIPKRGMWEYPGERNTPGGKTPGEKDRTPIDRVGNPIGTKEG